VFYDGYDVIYDGYDVIYDAYDVFYDAYDVSYDAYDVSYDAYDVFYDAYDVIYDTFFWGNIIYVCLWCISVFYESSHFLCFWGYLFLGSELQYTFTVMHALYCNCVYKGILYFRLEPWCYWFWGRRV